MIEANFVALGPALLLYLMVITQSSLLVILTIAGFASFFLSFSFSFSLSLSFSFFLFLFLFLFLLLFFSFSFSFAPFFLPEGSLQPLSSLVWTLGWIFTSTVWWSLYSFTGDYEYIVLIWIGIVVSEFLRYFCVLHYR